MPIKGELRPGMARARIQSRAPLPTTLSAADLARLSAELRSRAVFSARTIYAQHLQQINDVIARIVSPETEGDGPAASGSYMDPATARLALAKSLADVGYVPGTTGPIGSLMDLASDKRLNLIIKTNAELAWGYAGYASSQSPAALDAVPAQELYRLEDRKQKRNWLDKWVRAGGKTFEGGDDQDLSNRRLIALKSDPVWEAISEFGLPYPPFDYNSGMWVRDILRPEAEGLGLLGPGESAPAIDRRDFNDGLQASVQGIAQALQDSLLATLPADFMIDNGVLKRRPRSKNSYFGHSGRKGHVGGSSPRDEYVPNADAPEVKVSLHKGRKAMWKIMADHQDQRSAMSRPDVGDIDFVWSRKDAGIAHIIERREAQDRARPSMNKFSPEETVMKMVEVIAMGRLAHRSGAKIELKHDGFVAVLAESGRKSNSWILSGHEDSPERGGRR